MRSRIKAPDVARSQDLRLLILRADGMEHILGGEVVALGDLRLTWLAATERAALSQKPRSSSSMNCTIDATTTKQSCLRGVDDGIHLQLGDVGTENLHLRRRRRRRTSSTSSTSIIFGTLNKAPARSTKVTSHKFTTVICVVFSTLAVESNSIGREVAMGTIYPEMATNVCSEFDVVAT